MTYHRRQLMTDSQYNSHAWGSRRKSARQPLPVDSNIPRHRCGHRDCEHVIYGYGTKKYPLPWACPGCGRAMREWIDLRRLDGAGKTAAHPDRQYLAQLNRQLNSQAALAA